jgi:hypothetical protein
MKDLYYFAAWTDSGCLLGCDHQHKTIASAVCCIMSAGGYVIAVENGNLRQLNEVEEAEFQQAMYGSNVQQAPSRTGRHGVLIRVSQMVH